MSTVGWREWVILPDLGIPGIKAKIDTGAKTSSLHTFGVEPADTYEGEVARFRVHPLRKRQDIVIHCEAPIVDRRVVRDSGGHSEERYVIESRLQLGPFDLMAEFTLTSRDDMLFPMLLGRRAMVAAGIIVDVSQSYVHGKIKLSDYQDRLEEVTP